MKNKTKKSTQSKRQEGKKIVNLAIQGGGAHGAFTWGSLNQLLTDDRIDIEAITASSSGAMNAVVIAQGLMEGGKKGAIELLDQFWQRVSQLASMTPLTPTVFDRVLHNKNMNYSPYFMAADYLTRILSPYQFNFFDYNPLRGLLEDLIDFKKLSSHSPIKLFINATNVRTGKIKIFTNEEGLTLDMVMASACLPYLYKSVEVNGENYWDGGYSGNPAIFPLFYHCTCDDVIIIQISPLNIKDLPITAPDIMDRINEISFNATLIREMRAIAFIKKLLEEENINSKRYKNLHIHMIESEEILSSLGGASKLNADFEFLTYLKDLGKQTTNEWIKANFDKIGKESSLDIYEKFL